MSDYGISQGCDTTPHSHDTAGGNLVFCGIRTKKLVDGLGMTAGFGEMRVYKCRICTAEIEAVEPEILSFEE